VVGAVPCHLYSIPVKIYYSSASNYMTTEVILENEDIVIEGETPLDDNERDEGEVPVRLLEDFIIYDINYLEAVPISRLLEVPSSRHAFSASGLVKPWVEEESGDESEDSENEDDRGRMSVDLQWDRLSLSQICEFSVHSPSRKGKLDGYAAPIHLIHHPDLFFIRKIYIRTDFAWYILGLPSRQYIHLFRPYWLQHRILHLLVVASTDSRLTYEAFKDNIQKFDEAEDNIVTSLSILGRNLTTQDAESPDVVTILSLHKA
jgi:DNA (cytosine-5)-methyltransferase 1